MRKMLALILSLSVILGMCSYSALAADAEYSKAEQFAFGLDVIDEEKYSANAIASRAEFAEIVANICKLMDENKNYKEWADYVFGADNNNEIQDTPSDKLFTDVDSSLQQYEAIKVVYQRGYMSGMTETHFAPNYDITIGAVTKVLVSMLGYGSLADIKGGYPKGYMLVAGSKGMLDGVQATANDFASFGQIIKMIYNTLDVYVCDIKSVTSEDETFKESDETFLNRCLGLYRIKDRVTDNGISTFYGESRVGVKKLVVGGVVISIAECNYARSFLGREVEAYYRETENGENELAYMSVSAGDISESFDIEKLVSYTKNEIEYENERGSVSSVSLAPNAKLVYNNCAMGSYDESVFDYLYGNVTLISTTDGDADLIIVNDYMVGKIKKVVADTKYIYADTMYKDMADMKALNLSEKGGRNVFIENADGEQLSFSDLEAGDIISVLVSDNDSCIDITVCEAGISDYVISDFEISDKVIISDEETSYSLRGAENLETVPTINLGDKFSLFFDHNRNLVWFELASGNAGMKKAILVATTHEAKGVRDNYMVRIYDETGKLMVLTLDDKIAFNHSMKEPKDIFTEITNAIEDVILYETDSESGLLTSVILPLAYGVEDIDDRGWYAVSPKVRLAQQNETDEEWSTYKNENLLLYQSNGWTLGKFMIYNKGTAKLFTIPEKRSEFSEEKKFSVSSSFANDKGYLVNAYSADSKTVTPEVLVTASSSLTGGEVPNTSAFLIEKIVKGVDAEGEQLTKLKGYVMDYYKNSSVETTLNVDNDVVFYNAEDDTPLNSGNTILNPSTTSVEVNGPRIVSELAAGDIIRYSLNSNDRVGTIRVSYDYDEDNSFVYGSGDQAHISVGYPLYMRGEYVRISAERPENVELSDAAQAKATIAQHIRPNSIMVVYKVGGDIKIGRGTLDDVITYEDSGTMSEYNKLAVVTYWYGFTCGTVVYK